MKSSKIALIAVLTAIVYVLSRFLSPLMPFPFLPYLLFDLAEIIVILSLLLFGPLVAIMLEVMHFIALNFPIGAYPIIGPFMKFLAVSSTILGVYLGFKIPKSENFDLRLIYAMFLAIIIRVPVMTLANYLVLTFLFGPAAIDYFFAILSKLTGLTAGTIFEKLFIILIFTAIFNVLHVFLAVLPSYWIARLPYMQQLVSPISEHWLISLQKKK